MDKLLASQIIKANARLDEVMSSGSGASYTAGDGIDITSGEISAKIGEGLEFDANGAIKATGGEEWLDLTDLFEVDTANNTHHKIKSTVDLTEVIGTKWFRLTLECHNGLVGGVIGGHFEFKYKILDAVSAAYVYTTPLLNTVYDPALEAFSGMVTILADGEWRFDYLYGLDIQSESMRPKIIKVEVLK